MSPEQWHQVARLGLVFGSTVFFVLLTRSLTLAYLNDYGPPWKRRGNGRSLLDGVFVGFFACLAVLGIMSTFNQVRRTLRGAELPLTFDSLLVTGYVAIFGVFACAAWWLARRERLSRRKRGPDALH